MGIPELFAAFLTVSFLVVSVILVVSFVPMLFLTIKQGGGSIWIYYLAAVLVWIVLFLLRFPLRDIS